MLTCPAHVYRQLACHGTDGAGRTQAVGATLTCHVCLLSIYLEGKRRNHPREAVVMTADAMICGSGMGGGVVAALLAKAGAKAGPSPWSSPTLCHRSPKLGCICRQSFKGLQ